MDNGLNKIRNFVIIAHHGPSASLARGLLKNLSVFNPRIGQSVFPYTGKLPFSRPLFQANMDNNQDE